MPYTPENHAPEDIRRLREALQNAPSQSTPAYQQQLEAYYSAIGQPMPKPVSVSTQTEWYRDPSDPSDTLVQRQNPVNVYGAEARDILETGGVSVPGAGVVSSSMPNLEQQRDQILALQNQRRETGQRQISGQFAERADQLRETGQKIQGGIEGQLGIKRGLGASSSRMEYLRGVQKDTDKLLNDLERGKQEALQKLDFGLAEETANRLESLRKTDYDNRTMAINERMAALKEREAGGAAAKEKESETIANIVGSRLDELPSGRPFLTLPNGQRINFEDPNYDAYSAQPGVKKEDQNAFFDSLSKEYGVDRNSLETAFRSSMGTAAKEKPIIVAPGSSIYDPSTGELLGTAPIKPTADKPIVQEVGKNLLQYDSETGKWNVVFSDRSVTGTGTGGTPVSLDGLSLRAKAVYENPKLLESYTPTEKGKIITELASAGVDMSRFALEKVGASQRDQIAMYDDVLRESTAAIAMLDTGLNLGQIASRIGQAGAAVGGSKDFTLYRSSVDNMSSQLLKLRSGAAVTPQEFERIRGFIPQILDEEKTARTKIERFNTEIAAAQANYIKRSTQTVQQIVGGSDLNYTAPDGKTYTFPDKESADAFKKEAVDSLGIR